MKDDRQSCEAPISPARQAWLMLIVIAPMAACYPAIKLGLEFPPPLEFAGAGTLLGGLVLLLVLVIRRKPLWPEARLARWILPLGVLATTLTFEAMFASPAYTGAGIASVLGNTQPLIIIVLATMFLALDVYRFASPASRNVASSAAGLISSSARTNGGKGCVTDGRTDDGDARFTQSSRLRAASRCRG